MTSIRQASAARPVAAASSKPATAATSLKVSGFRIGDSGPKLPSKFAGKYAAQTKVTERSGKDSIQSPTSKKTHTLEYAQSTVTIGGKPVSGLGDVSGTRADFKASVLAGDLDGEFMGAGMGWDDSVNVSPAGGAGKFISVRESGNSYTGGAHPNHYTGLVTINAETGKAVTPKDILTAKQLDGIADQLLKSFKGMKEDDRMGFEGMFENKASVRELLQNTGFAINQDSKGNLSMSFDLDSGIHAMGGITASFSVALPNDAAMKAKLGL